MECKGARRKRTKDVGQEMQFITLQAAPLREHESDAPDEAASSLALDDTVQSINPSHDWS